jgi:Tfp pilus assembly protein PilE
MAAPPARNMRPIITVVAVIVVVILALVAYAGAGYAFANSRIDSARATYNTVVSHENALTEEFNSFNTSASTSLTTSTTTANLKSDQASYAQLVTKSQAAEPVISSDDAALVTAQASLKDNSWLTVISRSELDRVSAKIGHERNALASAKTITSDFVLLGAFYQALLQTLIDLDDVGVKAQATDISGTVAGIATLKTSIGKAQQLSSAPGVPADLKQFLTDMQTLAADLAKLFTDALAGSDNAVAADAKVATADANKVDTYDFANMGNEVRAFYQPLIDSFNSEVNKANSA